MVKRKAVVLEQECVACGTCEKVCPLGVITVYKGLYATVADQCVGCGRCKMVCPASVIQIKEVEMS